MGRPKKEVSVWSRQLKKFPKWVNMQELARAVGMQQTYLNQVRLGRTGLDSAQVKAILKEIKKLEKVVAYKQGELF